MSICIDLVSKRFVRLLKTTFPPDVFFVDTPGYSGHGTVKFDRIGFLNLNSGHSTTCALEGENDGGGWHPWIICRRYKRAR